MTPGISASIVRLLETVAGLDARSLGSEATLGAVLEREARQWNIRSVQEYCALVERHEGMLRSLLSRLIVPETFLFRYPGSFKLLACWARTRVERAGTGGRLRILCVPCASGEEAYSIAISLQQGGLTGRQFVIEGIDLCPAMIEKAIAGVYHDYSFRSVDRSVRDVYFAPQAGGYAVRAFLRENLTFQAANFFDLDASRIPGAYDVIFCRNLLIYLTGQARARCLHQLERWLAHDGLLFLGPAEVWMAAQAGWRVQAYPMAFACTPPQAAETAGLMLAAGGSSIAAGLPASPPAGRHHFTPETRPAGPTEAPEDVPALTKNRIKQLADRGRLAEAAAGVADLIRSAEPDAELLCLAGVLQSALGKQSEAERLFRKALYLDPKHVETLLHLALAKERAGRTDLARELRRRAASQQEP